MTVLLADPKPLIPDPPPPPGIPIPPLWPRGPVHNRQQATCPTCKREVAGLLAGCARPVCRTADLDYDAALERVLDR